MFKDLTYNPETGQLFRNGVLQAARDGHGYLVIKIAGKVYVQHRIAWQLMTGAPPLAEIDHINRVRSDNRWVNLREATKQQNAQNRAAHRNNSLKVRGVRKRHDGFYEPRLMKNGRAVYLGIFRTLEEAVKVRQQAEAKEFTHGTV